MSPAAALLDALGRQAGRREPDPGNARGGVRAAGPDAATSRSTSSGRRCRTRCAGCAPLASWSSTYGAPAQGRGRAARPTGSTEAATLAGAGQLHQARGRRAGRRQHRRPRFLDSLRRRADPQVRRTVVLGVGRCGPRDRGRARSWPAQWRSGSSTARWRAPRRSPQRIGPPCEAVRLTKHWSVPAGARIVVQATTVGMGDAEARLSLRLAVGDGVAATSSSHRRGPCSCGRPEAAGRRTLAGLGMLIEQAVIGFRWWTGSSRMRGDARGARAGAGRET